MFERLAHFSAVAALAAVLMVGSVPAPAQRASSGGPNINIGVSPMISPFGYGGFGYGPSLFGPSILPVPLPFGGMGPSASDQMLQQQQRRDESMMDGQARQIDALQKEIAELKA